MKKVNKFLLIILIMASFFSSATLAMETDVTENFYIETADKTVHTIKIDSEALRILQMYDIFAKAKGSGEKYKDPKILSTMKSFQLDLLEQTEFINIKPFDNQKITQVLVISSFFGMS